MGRRLFDDGGLATHPHTSLSASARRCVRGRPACSPLQGSTAAPSWRGPGREMFFFWLFISILPTRGAYTPGSRTLRVVAAPCMPGAALTRWLVLVSRSGSRSRVRSRAIAPRRPRGPPQTHKPQYTATKPGGGTLSSRQPAVLVSHGVRSAAAGAAAAAAAGPRAIQLQPRPVFCGW